MEIPPNETVAASEGKSKEIESWESGKQRVKKERFSRRKSWEKREIIFLRGESSSWKHQNSKSATVAPFSSVVARFESFKLSLISLVQFL